MKTGYTKMVKKLLAITRVDDAFAKVRSESGHICICVITFFLINSIKFVVRRW